MAASRARWLVTASRTERGGKAEPALLKWTTLATPGESETTARQEGRILVCRALPPPDVDEHLQLRVKNRERLVGIWWDQSLTRRTTSARGYLARSCPKALSQFSRW